MAGPFDHLKFFGADAPEDKAAAPVEETGFLRGLADTGIAAARGVNTGVKMVADAFGPNPVSRVLDEGNKGLDSLESPARQAERARRSQIIKEAEATGSTWNELKAYLGAFADAPVDTVVEGLGTSLPTILAAMAGGAAAPVAIARFAPQVAARLGASGTASAAALAARGAGAAAGGVQGAGAVKGAIYERVQRESLAAGDPPDVAAAKAEQAQAYTGPNAGDIAMGAGLGVLAGSVGAEGAVAGRVAGATGARRAADYAMGVVRTAGAEAGTEFLQGGQERLAENVAAIRAGYPGDALTGVLGQGALEGVAGAGAGGVTKVLLDREPPVPQPMPGQPAAPVQPPAPVVPGAAGPAAAPVAPPPAAAPAPAAPAPTAAAPAPVSPAAPAPSTAVPTPPAATVAPAPDPAEAIPPGAEIVPPVTPASGPLVRAANLGEPVAPPSPAVLAQQEADARAREVEGLTSQLQDVESRIQDVMTAVGEAEIVPGSPTDQVLQDLVGRRTALQDKLGIKAPARPTAAGPDPAPGPTLPPTPSDLAALMDDPEMAGLMGELGGILGAEKPAAAAAPAPVARQAGTQQPARPKAPPKNPFGVFLRKNGIDPDTARDILGEDSIRGNQMLPGAIRRGGMQIDKLAEAAVEAGYLTPADLKDEADVGGARKMAELIRRALANKERVQSTRQLESTLDDEMAAAAEARYGEEPAGPPRPPEMDDEGGAIQDEADADAADAELEPLITALMDELRAAVGDDAAVAVAERLSRMLEGRSADEYAAQLGVVVGQAQEQAAARARGAQEPARPDAGAGPQGGPGSGGPAQGRAQDEGEDPPVLTSYTPDEIVRRQEEKVRREREQAKKDAAPPPDDFRLTGSDRPADVAAAAGQMELGEAPAAPAVDWERLREMPGYYGDAQQPLRFASGMSRIPDFTTALEAGQSVGVEIGELSARATTELGRALAGNEGAHLFVDTGAFSVFRANLRAAAAQQITLPELGDGGTALDFDEILDRFAALDSAIAAADREQRDDGSTNSRAFFVMPDIVGDQAGSIELAARYKDEIQARSIRAIVPLQKGELSPVQAFDALRRAVGLGDRDTLLIGVPSNERAFGIDDLRELVAARGDFIEGLHFLGAASDSKLQPKLDVLVELGYDGNVSADANRLRALISGDTDRGRAMQELLAGGMTGKPKNTGRKRTNKPAPAPSLPKLSPDTKRQYIPIAEDLRERFMAIPGIEVTTPRRFGDTNPWVLKFENGARVSVVTNVGGTAGGRIPASINVTLIPVNPNEMKSDRLAKEAYKTEAGKAAWAVANDALYAYETGARDDGTIKAAQDAFSREVKAEREQRAADWREKQRQAADPLREQLDAVKDELGSEIDKLAGILGAKKNITPEDRARLAPVLAKIGGLLMKAGYLKFRLWGRKLLELVRAQLGADAAGKITIDDLQAAYISASQDYSGTDSKRDVIGVESIAQLNEDADAEPGRPGVEPDRPSGPAADPVGPGLDADGPGADQRPAPAGAEGTDRQGGRPDGRTGVSDDGAAGPGEAGDLGVSADAPGNDRVGPGDQLGEGGLRGGGDRVQPEPDAEDESGPDAQQGADQLTLKERIELQQAAEAIDVVPGDIENIRQTLPLLLPGQQEDVQFAEERFAKPDGHGVMFTNGTGTGKTILALGIIKRQAKQGRENALIVAPNEGVQDQWVKDGKMLGLSVTRLENTRDPGKGVVVTTYANLWQNRSLVDREWDMIIPDESHTLMKGKDGDSTAYMRMFRALAAHPEGFYAWFEFKERALFDKLEAAREAKDAARESAVLAQIEAKREAREAEFKARTRPKVTFLSATPFAYEKALRYAEGFLFEYGDGGERDFLIQHFGWRIRQGNLTKPDANVDSSLMQVRFNQWLKDQGVLSGRMLESEYDYDRKFWTVDDAIGTKIDEGALFLRDGEDGRWRALYDLYERQFDYLTRARLLEAIKAKHVVPLIKQYLAKDRKVVVFHDYKSGGGFAPFQFFVTDRIMVSTKDKDGKSVSIELPTLIKQFRAARPDLWNMDFSDYADPITVFKEAFDAKQLGIYNGDVKSEPNKKRDGSSRAEIKEAFNTDGSGKDVVLVQAEAGGAGLSLHDTTGNHPRVLINLGLPVAPVTAIQQEGRIYRVGQKSNAPFRYLNTGTTFEANTFARKIAERVDVVENLGMGVLARGLKRAFIMAFNGAAQPDPGAEGEGTGGKKLDRSLARQSSPTDTARSLYYAQKKRGQRDKSFEGVDYYPTPEPVGLAMANWLGLRNGERVLEPSAGHGAIAQWFGGQLDRTALEPSLELSTRLRLAFDGKVREERFEDLDTGANKFDGIAMNPPFGRAGATAIAHLTKAFKHLQSGGRIVAIIPRGAADEKFETLMASQFAKSFYLRGSIELPGIAFERAGTKIRTRLVVIDRLDGDASRLTQRSPIDLTGIDNINELFDAVDAIEMPMRPGVTKAQLKPDAKKVTAEQSEARAALSTVPGLSFETVDTTSKTDGRPLFNAKPTIALSGPALEATLSLARKHKGWYANFVKTFMFREAAQRDAFVAEMGGQSGPDAMLSRVADGELDPARRRLLGAMAAAAVAPSVGRAGPVTIGRAQAIAEQVLLTKVSPEVEKILRGEDATLRGRANGSSAMTSLDGAKRTRRALDAIAQSGPPELRALAARISRLIPDKGFFLTVNDTAQVAAHGMVRHYPMPEMILFTRDGRQGLTHATFMHEALHAAVLARYKNLQEAIPRANDARLGAPEPKAAAALAQFRLVWREFGDMAAIESRGMTDARMKLSIEEAANNPDEFFVRALTDARLQAWMAEREYKGKTLWDRFKDWVKSSLLGFKREGTAPSWLDAALAASNDLVAAMEADPADYKRAEASFELQRGQPGQQRDAMYSLAVPSSAQVKNAVVDLLKTHKQFNWWHKTIGTQYEKAQSNPYFKAVFDRVQTFLDDVSRFANEAADLAPGILPKLSRIRDALDPRDPLGRKHAADMRAIAKPIFEGTLYDPDPAKGKVWTDAELRQQYQLTDRQIRLYREFRAATDKSLDTTLRATLIHQLGEKAVGIEDQIMAAPDAQALDTLVVNRLAQLRAVAAQNKKQAFNEAIAESRSKIARIEGLKAGGYAPLMRFGNHSVYAYKVDPVTGDIDQLFFSMYDTEREANAARRELEADPAMAGAIFEQGPVPTEMFKLFQGVDPDAVELFAQAAGVSNEEMVQAYIKATKNNRSALRRLIQRKGTAGFSEDVTRTLAAFLTSNSRQASMNLHGAAMRKAAEQIPKTQGDVQNEAVRLIEYVQTPSDTGAKIRSLLFFQFIGGSIASAITNLTQPVTMSFPYLSQFGGATKAANQLRRAMLEATKGVSDPAIAAALARAEDEGIVSPQEIHHLYSEAGAGVSNNAAWKRLSFLWGSLFSASEQWNRRSTFIAAYRTAQDIGHADPFAFAEKAVEETQGIYNKGNRPNWARGAVGGLVLTFKQFSVAYVEFFKRLPRKQKLIALAVLMIFSGIEGIPFAEDLQDLVDTVAQAAGLNFSSKRAMRQWAAKVVGQGGAEFIMRGTSTLPGVPIDVSARMGLGNLVPGTGLFMQSKTDKTRELTEPLGAFGSFVRQMLTAGEKALEGEFGAAFKAAAPVAAANALKGADMAATGMYRDERGRRVVDTTLADAFAKGIGFQPAGVAQAQRTVTMALQRIDMARNREAKIAEKWARGIFESKPELVAEARAEMQSWNSKNADSRIAINSAQIQRRVKAMRLSRADRIAKAAPREFRQSVQDEVGAMR